MAIVKKEIDYAKEIGDVFVLVEEIVKVIKAKGNYTELFDELIAAVEGVQNAGDEFELNKKASIQTATFHVGGIVDALIKKQEA